MFDFTSEYIAEEIYNFIDGYDLWSDVADKNMSMLEYVTFVCPLEFREFLKERGYDI